MGLFRRTIPKYFVTLGRVPSSPFTHTVNGGRGWVPVFPLPFTLNISFFYVVPLSPSIFSSGVHH